MYFNFDQKKKLICYEIAIIIHQLVLFKRKNVFNANQSKNLSISVCGALEIKLQMKYLASNRLYQVKKMTGEFFFLNTILDNFFDVN